MSLSFVGRERGDRKAYILSLTPSVLVKDMTELSESKIKALQAILFTANCNLVNLKVQFDLLNKNLEALDSSLGILYEEFCGAPKWKTPLYDVEEFI